MELMIGLNGYAVGSGLLDASLNTTDFNVIKLKEEDILTLGYIVRKGNVLSDMGQVHFPLPPTTPISFRYRHR